MTTAIKIAVSPKLHVGQPHHSRIGEFLAGALFFVPPCLLFVELRLGGRLLLTELILLAVLPLLIFRKGRRLLAWEPRLILSLGLLWLFGQVCTDLIRSTPFEDLARGWCKITFTLTNFAAIYLLTCDYHKRLIGFSLGMSLGLFLMYILNPSEFAQEFPWKYGVGTPLSLLVLLMVSLPPIRRARLAQVSVTMGLGLLNIVMGARSLGGVCLLAGMLLLLQSFLTRKAARQRRINWKLLLVFCLAQFLLISCIILCYNLMASSGWLGEDAQRTFEIQSSGDFGVLLGGRVESIASLRAVLDSPFVGHGSWAKGDKYIDYLYSLRDLGYDAQPMINTYSKLNVIPTHSYLMGAWVEAGILGALFWAAVFVAIPPLLFRLAAVEETWTPIIAYHIFLLAWAIPFSPLGYDGRITSAYTLVVLAFLAQMKHPSSNRSMQKIGCCSGVREGVESHA